MAEAVLDIKQWGNNLGVCLPAAVARAANQHPAPINTSIRVNLHKPVRLPCLPNGIVFVFYSIGVKFMQ